jgi:signal transduction histidine kinase
MEIILLYLPLMAAFLILTDFKDSANRWGIMALLLASIGGLYSLTRGFFIDFHKWIINSYGAHLLSYFPLLLFKTPLVLYPVTFLMFTFRYSHPDYSRNLLQKPIILSTLMIPVVTMYMIPLNHLDFAAVRRFLFINDLWALPYMTTAYYFLYRSIVTANYQIKTERLLNALVIGIMSFLYIIAVYILPFFHYAIYQFNPYLIICFLALLAFLMVKYGFLGVKLSIRSAYLDNAIKTIGSETVVMNHHIKDELEKISACAYNIIIAAGFDQDRVTQSTQTILASAGYLSNVVERLQQYLYQVNINPTEQSLAAIVDEAIAYLEPVIQEKAVRVYNHLHREFLIKVDRLYLVKALTSILQNSLESMKKSGNIQIDLFHSSQNVTLIIADTGCGITSEDLPHVLEPFYTTKDPARHFGLGLSYSYHVMQQHGGGLEIKSSKESGTIIFLKFPI